MKKTMALLLILVMSFALAACGGGVDTQPAIDAFNEASTAFDEVGAVINADPDAFDQELIDVMVEMAGLMTEYKDLLESGADLTQEQVDEMVAWFGDVESWVEDVKAAYGI